MDTDKLIVLKILNKQRTVIFKSCEPWENASRWFMKLVKLVFEYGIKTSTASTNFTALSTDENWLIYFKLELPLHNLIEP